jgi:PHD/YefM family antitoxin component YafN of YafNO toxin-antitoxin module
MAESIENIPEELPLHDLDPKTRELIEKVLASGRPLHFTRGGERAALLLDADAYREQQRRLALMEHLARSRRDLDAGHGMSQEQVEALMDEWLPLLRCRPC